MSESHQDGRVSGGLGMVRVSPLRRGERGHGPPRQEVRWARWVASARVAKIWTMADWLRVAAGAAGS
ncbi:hypothetical protein RKD42_000664 [Streptomyces ambofaciens]